MSSSIYLMRARLYTLGQSLNLFGFNDQLEFNSVAEQTLSHSDLEVYRQPKLRSTEVHSPKSKIQSPTDDVITGTIETSMADREIFEDISYLGLSDDGSYEASGDLDFEANAITDDLEDLSFDQRFEQLLAEKDFAFARELLDFTRYNEINDERYHCERLRLLEKMQDEDGFYAYYYGIESQISTFPQNLQTQISRLVVMLAHR
ncbi:MAG: hypothetical protein JKX81_04890 [Arenicella sp.]|nr:hypothetical protein [Arenicella sp.]